MSVIGIDFGNESCYVAAAKAGGIETLANDYSLRATPSCVAFAGKKRIIGVAAKNQQVTNMKNTITNFKRFLGRKFNDPQVQQELKTTPYKVEQRPDGGVGIRVNYLDEDHVFSPEQITAMLFSKLKETSLVAMQAQVNDCVITVPVFFTNAERRALLDAGQIAGLNVLRLMNETTAIALSYGFYKQDLPGVEEKPRNVIFVDFGHASLQVSACAFNKGKLKMICSAWDQIGGRDFDDILANEFAKEFQMKYKINAKTNARAWLRLLTEVEKIKKNMSANSTKLPLNIECFMEEIDVHSSMARSDMEHLCEHLLKRTKQTLLKCLNDSKLSCEEIYSVEVVGGSTRIPAVKTMIEHIFQKAVSTTLNLDEAVSRGAALQCAIMSPAVRVRDFSVTDIQNYAVKVSWDGEMNQIGEMEVFPAFHAAPFSRLLTLFRREPFNLNVYYADPHLPYPDPFIGHWYVKDVKPNVNGESQEVKVKVRINHNGIVLVSSASLVDKNEEVAENEPNTANENNTGENMEVQENCDEKYSEGDQVSPQSPSSAKGPGWAQRMKGWFSSNNGEEAKGKEKKKKSNKLIELPIDGKTHGYSTTELQNYQEQEWKMIDNDQMEKERVDARNALEEYVYDMRDKLSSDGPLSTYVVNNDRESICNQLNDLENWLYEEGEECDRDTYRTKLNNLHSQTDPIKMRSIEYERQPSAFEDLSHLIQMTRKSLEECRTRAPKYEHLLETEIINLTESADKAQKWFDDHVNKFSKSSRTSDPLTKVDDIRREYQTLSACANSVLNRQKPKPATPAPPPANNTAHTENPHQNDKSADGDSANVTEKNSMDVE